MKGKAQKNAWYLLWCELERQLDSFSFLFSVLTGNSVLITPNLLYGS